MPAAADDRYVHCPVCSAGYDALTWPRRCTPCGSEIYRNPAPVGLVLVPIDDDGVLLVRRDIEPRRGWLSLPGGYLDVGESWQQGAARELWEEAGLVVAPETLVLHDVHSTDDGTHLLVMALAPSFPGSALSSFAPNSEVSELAVLRRSDPPQELAFPLHQRAVGAYLGWRAD